MVNHNPPKFEELLRIKSDQVLFAEGGSDIQIAWVGTKLTPPNNTLHQTHSETAQERPASPDSGAISKDVS